MQILETNSYGHCKNMQDTQVPSSNSLPTPVVVGPMVANRRRAARTLVKAARKLREVSLQRKPAKFTK